ncbi:MAG: type II pantothenate kinase [Clostridia bacterium]|nr:type II pantothenate kinase [Clostridia bacterium]
MQRTVIGIDVGGSTTKIVGFREDGDKRELLEPMFVRATDPITSIYGAFGKFTSLGGLSLADIDRVMVTGVGSTYITTPIYGLRCIRVPEFSCVGRGGIYLSGLDDTIVVSMGTGTAFIHANRNGLCDYLGGTGVGGGTLVGLSRKMLGMDNIDHIEQLCETGDLSKIDLRVGDMSDKRLFPELNHDLTASNFGKVSDLANRHDVALGIANMVSETIAMMAIFAARGFSIDNIVLTGNLTTIKPVRDVFDSLEAHFGIKFTVPQNAQFGTVIGAALSRIDEGSEIV